MRMTAIFMAGALLAAPAGASDVFGVWQSEKNDDGAYILVDIGACAADATKVCGRIVDAISPITSDKPDWVGRNIIENMVAESATKWSDGTIWAPDDDSTYSSEMELKGSVLTVSGCVLGGLICRGQDWTRAN